MRIIGGSARGRRLRAPPDRAVRPALERTREAIFSILGHAVEGARVLDLYAGVGAFGLEALSRGARHATFVDISPSSLSLTEANIRDLAFRRQSRVLCGDALAVPDRESLRRAPFSLVFLDPPFPLFADTAQREPIIARASELIRCGAPDGQVVLRYPSSHREPLPFHHVDLRRHGESLVAFLSLQSLDPGLGAE